MKHRKRFLPILFLHSWLIIFTPYAGAGSHGENPTELLGKPLQSEEIMRVVNTLKELQKHIDAVSAIVYQKKKTSLLAKEISTEGTMILKKPNLLRWEVKTPEPLTIIVDGKTMWVYHPNSKEAQRYILSEQFIARQTMEFFSSTMSLSLDEIKKRFDIAVYKPGDSFVLEMRPKSTMTAKYLTAVYIWYKQGAAVPYRFEVIGKNGNTTVTELRDVVSNPPIQENTFHFDIPAGATVTNTENEGMGY